MNSTYCSFYRNDGRIVYKYINMITGQPDKPMSNCNDGEIINEKDIFVNLEGNKFYHKTHNNFDYNEQQIVSDDDNDIFLEWKQTNKGDWDWYKIDNIILSDIVQIQELFDKSFNDARNLDERIKYLKMKTEIMAQTFVISKLHNLNTNDTSILTNIIEQTIQTFIDTNLIN